MNRETDVRRQMTPDVLNDIGKTLVELAKKNKCGARFTGAGGGGCIWALGEIEKGMGRDTFNNKCRAFAGGQNRFEGRGYSLSSHELDA